MPSFQAAAALVTPTLQIERGDAHANLLPDELCHLLRAAGAAAGRRHKRAHADVDRESALDQAGDGTEHGALVFKRFLERAVVGRCGDPLPRELVVAVQVPSLHGDAEPVAGLDRLLIRGEARKRKHAFRLVGDIEKDAVSRDRHDRGIDLLRAPAAVYSRCAFTIVLAQQLGEVYFRVFRQSLFGRIHTSIIRLAASLSRRADLR